MKGKSAKKMLPIIAAAVLVLLVFAGCDPLMNLFQGDIDVAGTWVDTYGDTWIISNTALTVESGYSEDYDYSGTIVYYSNADQYFIFQNTNPSSDLDQDRYVKMFWRNLDLNADVKMEMGGAYDADAEWGVTSSYWATQAEAEDTTTGDVELWSSFVTYTAPAE